MPGTNLFSVISVIPSKAFWLCKDSKSNLKSSLLSVRKKDASLCSWDEVMIVWNELQKGGVVREAEWLMDSYQAAGMSFLLFKATCLAFCHDHLGPAWLSSPPSCQCYTLSVPYSIGSEQQSLCASLALFALLSSTANKWKLVMWKDQHYT